MQAIRVSVDVMVEEEVGVMCFEDGMQGVLRRGKGEEADASLELQ